MVLWHGQTQLADRGGEKMVTPNRRRVVVDDLMAVFGVSQRRACRVVGQRCVSWIATMLCFSMFATIACGEASPVDPVVAAGLDTGFFSQDNVEYENYFRVRWAEVEDVVAECMNAAGFSYVPAASKYYAFDARPPTSTLSAPRVNDDGGYGIVAGILATARLEVEPDPNLPYIDALSEAEAEAFFQALIGFTGPDGRPAEGTCRWEAVEEVWGRDRAVREATSETLSELAVRIEADPDFVNVASLWSECMAASGFEFAAQADIARFVTNEVFAVPRPGGDIGPAYADAWAQELDVVFELERSIAAADTACVAPHQSEIDAVIEKHYKREFGADWQSFAGLYVQP